MNKEFSFNDDTLSKKNLDSILSELNETKLSIEDSPISYERVLTIEETLSSDNPIIVKGVAALLMDAVNSRTTDIHIESSENSVRIRFRIDGILIEKNFFDKSTLNSIISRLKILANLDITERRIPQDGSMRLKIKERAVDFRLSTIPTIHGEKAVIRILDKSFLNLNLSNLGFDLEDYNKIIKILNLSAGLILLTGPTGSGKSTTLYSMINYLNTPEINISTIEDPVEYSIKGINQIQVKPEINLNFSSILKQLLRQDPDIIVVGEIRDSETADLAVRAALTGHLIFSTLHTNDALTTIDRLRSLGVDDYLIATTFKLIISQRLVRKLCPHCKIEDINYKTKLTFFNQECTLLEDPFFFTHANLGCPHCNNTGYFGRVPIYEILTLNDFISYKKTLKQGINHQTLLKCGLKKAASHITSLDEIINIL